MCGKGRREMSIGEWKEKAFNLLIQIHPNSDGLSDPFFPLGGNENKDISYEQQSERIIFDIIFLGANVPV